MGLRVLDASGQAVPVAVSTDSVRSSAANFSLTGDLTVLLSAVTAGNCSGCEIDPSTARRAALALLEADAQSQLREHAAWWRLYWEQVPSSPLH